MKSTLFTAVTTAAVLSLAGAFNSHSQTATERLKDAASDAGDALRRAGDVIAQESREAWTKTKAYFTEDPATYQSGANQKIEELRKEVDQLRERSGSAADRAYLQTRILALEQQLQFSRQQLAALPPEEIRKGREGERRHVDDVLARLEAHLDITRGELDAIDQAKK